MPSKKTKANTIKKIQTCLTSYQNILIGDAKNLPTEKIQNIRKALRKINTEVVCGNKHVITEAINNYFEITQGNFPSHVSYEILNMMPSFLYNLNIMIIFTNEDAGIIGCKLQELYKGVFPLQNLQILSDVILPSGKTDLRMGNQIYFQELKIPITLSKDNFLSIVGSHKLLSAGQVINDKTAKVLKLMNCDIDIKLPIKIKTLIIKGNLYPLHMLRMTPYYLNKLLHKAVDNITAYSIGINYLNNLSAPYINTSFAFDNRSSMTSLIDKEELKERENVLYVKKKLQEGIRNITAFSLQTKILNVASASYLVRNAYLGMLNFQSEIMNGRDEQKTDKDA